MSTTSVVLSFMHNYLSAHLLQRDCGGCVPADGSLTPSRQLCLDAIFSL